MSIITEEMVAAKEAQNLAKMKELQSRAGNVSSAVQPPPNFPPECCCVKPIIYHNISLQIPTSQQRFMYILCGLYLSQIVLIVYNVVAALVMFIFGGSAMHFGLSFIYLLGIPGAFMFWYYNIYSAFVKLSRLRQVLGLLGLLLGLGLDIWMAIGVYGLGGCGYITAFAGIGTGVAFIMVLIAAILWTLHGVLMFSMFVRFWAASARILKDAHNVYRENII